MIVGYARTSTVEQKFGLEAQVDELKAAGCERIFSEQVSSVAKRHRLDEIVAFVRDGDVLVVTKLDRLARSVKHLWQIVGVLQDKGVGLRILNISLDTSTATGKLMLSLLGAVAEFEREMMLERQREGIFKAKASGKKFGRPATAQAKADEIAVLRQEGLGASEIARRVGVSRASVYIHDSKLAWFRSIGDINNNLKQKGGALALQIDVTATPKHTNGAIFVQTIADYPLVEAPILNRQALWPMHKEPEQKSNPITRHFKMQMPFLCFAMFQHPHRRLWWPSRMRCRQSGSTRQRPATLRARPG